MGVGWGGVCGGLGWRVGRMHHDAQSSKSTKGHVVPFVTSVSECFEK